MKLKRILYAIPTLFCFVISPPALIAEGETKHKSTVDVGAWITKELMQMKMDDDVQYLVFWFPFEFFAESAVAQGQTMASVEGTLGFLKPYLTIAVSWGIGQPDGSSVYPSEKEVRARVIVRLADGSEVQPLDEVPPFVLATLAGFQALSAAQSGAPSHFLVFPPKNKQGDPIVDTSKMDKLMLVFKAHKELKEMSFTWRTPFDATTPAAPCPKCGEFVSPKWIFCPWDGTKLIDKKVETEESEE